MRHYRRNFNPRNEIGIYQRRRKPRCRERQAPRRLNRKTKMKTARSHQRVSIDGMRPLALTKKQIIAVLGSAKLVDRMLWATRHAEGKWFLIIREGRDLLVATESVESAYVRLVEGELPPLMPSERKPVESGVAR